MHFSRSLSALPVLLLAASTALPAQVMGSSFGEAAQIGGQQMNNVPCTSTIIQTLANGAAVTRTGTK